MQVTIISQEKGSAKVQVTFPGDALSKALDKVYAEYTKTHEDFQVPRADIAARSRRAKFAPAGGARTYFPSTTPRPLPKPVSPLPPSR